MNKRVWIISALTLLLLPATAWAQRPEVDCNTLPEADMQRFYELSGEMSQAVDDQNFEEALSVAKQAMAMCTSDTYTEYTLARLYDLTNDCPDAFYHYEVLANRPDSVKKENADIYKELNKHLKNIRKKCGDAVTVEVTCPTPETRLQIASNNVDTVCPYYGKLMPGSYTVMLSKPDYVTVKETINVDPNSSGNFTTKFRNKARFAFVARAALRNSYSPTRKATSKNTSAHGKAKSKPIPIASISVAPIPKRPPSSPSRQTKISSTSSPLNRLRAAPCRNPNRPLLPPYSPSSESLG